MRVIHAAAVIAILAGPAYAQTQQPVPRYGEAPKDKTPQQIEHLAKMPPMERLAQPDDISNVVAFLVGPDAGWVDGQTLRVNGGLV